MSGSNKLPSIPLVISVLIKSGRTFYETLKYLVKHLKDAGSSTALSIITPMCLLAAKFDNTAWSIINKFHFVLFYAGWTIRDGTGAREYKQFEDHLLQIESTCRFAREELVPAIKGNLDRIELPLVSELRGSYGLETFLRFIKHIPGFWSVRIDLLDDIPDIISSIYNSCRTMMTCLDCVEQYSRLIQTRFQDKEWVSQHQGRPDLIWCLSATRSSVTDLLPGLRCHRDLEVYLSGYVNLVSFNLAGF
ncbi:hypothetical protein EV421DRAFT_1904495 [Armillaria borealis]|uniref:Uncharacterized protein n=1 Tax=Armillaria borealis TaxID=47425 RepID=A0AA39JFN4_9AGAR|nr:hypothetical protein EV421DRAFT_1904495 [Armillaria borealis]